MGQNPGEGVYTKPVCTVKPCGSGLARDGVITVTIDVARPTAIAGKPAPTGNCGVLMSNKYLFLCVESQP
jgi:hypothetical protein